MNVRDGSLKEQRFTQIELRKMTDDTQKIGIGLTSFGVLFMALGVLFFFDRALLSFGNVLFIAGVSLTIGRKRALKFFVNRRRVPS